MKVFLHLYSPLVSENGDSTKQPKSIVPSIVQRQCPNVNNYHIPESTADRPQHVREQN